MSPRGPGPAGAGAGTFGGHHGAAALKAGLIWNTLNHDFTLRLLFFSKTTKCFNHSLHKLRILSVLLFGHLGLIADHTHNFRVFDLGNKGL